MKSRGAMPLVLLILLGATASAAELQWGFDQPYRLTVCLRFSDDPIFTHFYTASVRRQVRDQLANYFEKLVDLEVVSEHPLLARIETAGLASLTTWPDDLDQPAVQDKLFLATIDWRDGLYRIQWRQLDGDVERVGPLRSRATPDRQWLAKAVCLAVKDDFAPVALVEPEAGGERVGLKFQGAGRGPRLAALLADGCVLQPYWVIRRQGGTLSRIPIPYTVLRIEPGENPGQATLVSSLADPWRRTARVAGFQAIKLSTCSGRFRLRLVDADSGSPIQTCQVYAGSRGFRQLGDEDRLDPPDRHGCVVAPRPFADLAYVEIVQSGGAASRILLPITDAWCEEVCKLRVEEQAGEKGNWQRDAAVLVQDVQVLQGMLDQYVRDLNRLNENKQYEQALQQVRQAMTTLRPLLVTARGDMSELRSRAARLELESDQRLAWVVQQLQEVDARVTDLGTMDGKLEETLRKIEVGKLAAMQAQLAEDLLRQGDVDQAIANYREAARLSPESGFDKRLDELNATWQIKDDDHRKARAFVFEIWPEARITQIDELLPEAQDAFEKLVEVDDYLTVRRLLKATGEHLRELSDLVDMLLPRTTEADRQDCERYMKLTDKTARFQLDVSAYLKNRLESPSAPPAPKPAAPRDDQEPAVQKPEEEEEEEEKNQEEEKQQV